MAFTISDDRTIAGVKLNLLTLEIRLYNSGFSCSGLIFVFLDIHGIWLLTDPLNHEEK